MYSVVCVQSSGSLLILEALLSGSLQAGFFLFILNHAALIGDCDQINPDLSYHFYKPLTVCRNTDQSYV